MIANETRRLPEAVGGERRERGDVTDHPAEVHAEEADDERERQEDRRDERQLLGRLVLVHADLVLADAQDGQVGLKDARQQLALCADLVVDQLDVVVHVAKVVLDRSRDSRVGAPLDRRQAEPAGGGRPGRTRSSRASGSRCARSGLPDPRRPGPRRPRRRPSAHRPPARSRRPPDRGPPKPPRPVRPRSAQVAPRAAGARAPARSPAPWRTEIAYPGPAKMWISPKSTSSLSSSYRAVRSTTK